MLNSSLEVHLFTLNPFNRARIKAVTADENNRFRLTLQFHLILNPGKLRILIVLRYFLPYLTPRRSEVRAPPPRWWDVGH